MRKYNVFRTILSYETDNEEFDSYKEALKDFEKKSKMDSTRKVQLIMVEDEKDYTLRTYSNNVFIIRCFVYDKEEEYKLISTGYFLDYDKAYDYALSILKDTTVHHITMEESDKTVFEFTRY